MKKSKSTVNSTHKAKPLPRSPGNACGASVSTSTKANGGKNALAASDALAGQAPASTGDVARLLLKLAEQQTPRAEDCNRLRRQIAATPESWPLAADAPRTIQQAIVEKLYSHGVMRAAMLAKLDILKTQMDYDRAPALVQMHIEHVLTAWLRLQHAEMQFSHSLSGESFATQAAQFWQDFLEAAQARFLRASESLAKLRRLARNTPAMQINIAGHGGQQVNMQNDAV